MRRVPRGFGAATLLVLMLASFAAQAAGIAGYWLKHGDYGNSAVIEIYASGDGFDGRIVRVQRVTFVEGDRSVEGEIVPQQMIGTVKADVRNPDPALRGRAILGLRIISGFRPDSATVWSGASIYNPEDGDTYHCKATLSGDDQTLTVRGYIGVPLLGESQTWTRLVTPDAAGWN